MLNILIICLEVLVFFNLMIVVHELGHFLAARWRGLVVDRFGIWFGKPLWQKKIGGVWYSLGSIPAGGFVALPQLAPMELIEGGSGGTPRQLPPITPLDKIIVAFAGPLFSFGLAAALAVVVWQVGRPVSEAEATTTIGFVLPNSPAEKAGLRTGDRLLEVDGHAVNRWGGTGADSVAWRVVSSVGDTVPVKFERDGRVMTVEASPVIPETRVWQRRSTRQLQIAPAETPMIARVEPGSAAEAAGLRPNDLLTEINGQRLYSALGIGDFARRHPQEPLMLTVERGGQTLYLPFRPSGARVGGVVPDGPAGLAGVQAGDLVLAVDGRALRVAEEFSEYIQKNGDRKLTLTVERGGVPREIAVVPRVPEGDTLPRIGIAWSSASDGMVFDSFGRSFIVHPGPWEQIRTAALSIVNTLDALTSRNSDIKLQHMSGPVMILRIYYLLFENADGWRMALWFSVLLNVNLAILNLLPLPVLDGGHIVLALVEAARRRPMNPRALLWLQNGCAALLIGFMLYVTFFDVQDFFGGGERAVPEMRFKSEK
ncbi:MAG: site-2 protease family protein [Limisphaerales bacterium]